MGLGWGLFNGYAGDGEPHAHHAVQLLLADSPQWVWARPAGRRAYEGLVIGADVEHRVEPTSASVTMLYVEPHSVLGHKLQGILVDGLHELGSAEVMAARSTCSTFGNRPNASAVEALVTLIAGPSEGTSVAPSAGDPRIQQLLDALPEVLPDRLTAAHLAERVGLSQSRFLHCFTAHTGLPLRPYLRWRRLLTAMTQIMSGHSLTDAAVEAGFADAAHFTRTFRRHFGIAPRTLAGMVERR